MSDSQMSVEFQALASAQNSAVKATMQTLQDFDFTLGYELDRRLKANPDLLAEFAKNPAEVAKREVGIEPPPGFHMHFITENNEYIPPEGDALSQLQLGKDGKVWSRVEIRTAVGPGCFAFCGICGQN